MSIADKLNYLEETKTLIMNKIKDLGGDVTAQTNFRDYVDALEDVYTESPKVTGEGTSITLNNTRVGKMELELKGDAEIIPPTTGIEIPTEDPFTFIGYDEQSHTVPQITNAMFDRVLGGGSTAYQNGELFIYKQDWGSWYRYYLVIFSKNDYAYLDGNVLKTSNTGYSWRVQDSWSPYNWNGTDYWHSATLGGTNPEVKLVYSTADIYTDINKTGIAYQGFGQPGSIDTVTGNQTITIENTDYSLSLGNIELVTVGTHTDKFEKSNGNWIIANKVQKIDSYNGETITTDYISSTGELDTGATVYYNSNQTLIITDNILIEQLDALNNVFSSNNTTTISSSGSLPIIIKATALQKA